MRIIISNGLTPALFSIGVTEKSDDITAILSLDALTISEEVENIRNDRHSRKNFSAQDKLLIRFEPQYEMVLKLISTFVLKVGVSLAAT